MSKSENARRAARVELGERIVEQEERRAAGPLTERSRFEHPQRDRRRPLLARRAEDAQVAAVERDDEIVAMRAGVREPAAQVVRPLLLERRARARPPDRRSAPSELA